MKSFLKISTVVMLSLVLQTCKKITLPEVTTGNVSEISQTSATSGGEVTNNGGEEVTARGICWSTDQKPTITSGKTSDGSGNGSFTSKITGLSANTTYYIRAYATNNEGVGYGNEISFKTIQVPLATLTTTAISAITSTTAASGGNITQGGGSDITARGVCWNTSPNPTTENYFTNEGPGTGSFTSNLTNLQPATTYYVRAYATSSDGTVYADELSFITLCAASAPAVGTTTQPTCDLGTGSVILSGLPASGTWTLTRTPGGIITTGTGTSTTISGLEPDTYTFTVADASGCVSPASGNIIINSQTASPSAPVVGTITQPTCALATGSVELSGLPSTGSWTITRTPGGTTTTGTGSSTTIQGLSAGSYTFTVTNTGGCVSAASANVVINSQPITPSAPVIGTITQAICPITTGSVALSGLPSAGTWTLTRTPGGTTTTGTGSTANVPLLPAGGTYTFTVTNAAGCSSVASQNVVINILALPSAVTGAVASNITPTSATFTGTVNGNGSPSVVTFEYGTTASYGTEVPADQSPVTNGDIPVSREVTNLTMNTLYHYRVKIVSCAGAVYGHDQVFRTPLPFTTSGLVAYYPFNGNADDESGNGNNGVLVSGATITTDKNGVANRACRVNPGFVEIADNPSLRLSSYTLSIWFKAEQVNMHFNCLIGKNYVVSYGLGFDFGGSVDCPAPMGITRPVRAYVGNNGYFFNTSNITCGTEWYHVVVTYNSANGDMNLYLNGNLWENVALSPGAVGTSSDPLAIGKDGFYGDKFNGVVDEVSIFNRALTFDEVAQLFNYY